MDVGVLLGREIPSVFLCPLQKAAPELHFPFVQVQSPFSPGCQEVGQFAYQRKRIADVLPRLTNDGKILENVVDFVQRGVIVGPRHPAAVRDVHDDGRRVAPDVSFPARLVGQRFIVGGSAKRFLLLQMSRVSG